MNYPHLGPLLQILATIEREKSVDLDRLQEVTGLSHPTLKRHIQAARQHGVIIEWTGDGYVIRDWGAVNPAWLERRPVSVGNTTRANP